MCISKVREIHTKYKNGDKTVPRDVMIVAHGHFGRVLISRWIQFPLHLGENGFYFNYMSTTLLIQFSGTHFTAEAGGVSRSYFCTSCFSNAFTIHIR